MKTTQHILHHLATPVLKPLHSLKKHISLRHSTVSTPHSCPEDLHTRLCACPQDVPVYDWAGQHFWVRIIEMHDADSLKVVLELNGCLYKVMTRLIGIDSPEIRTKDADERVLAIRSRDRAAQWALPNTFVAGGAYTEKTLKEALWANPVIVLMECRETDKYGRVLVEFRRDGLDTKTLNQILIDEGYADVYDGGTKLRSWDHKD